MKKPFVEVYGRTFSSYSREEIHPRISELIRQFPKGKVLDFPAGSGTLAWRLHNEGYEVTGADIDPKLFQVPEVRIVAADLNRPFPFNDNSFDYACFVEGPEHVENVFQCFREFGRVLKPGGILFTTIPNYSNLENRLKSLFFGTSEPVISREKLWQEHGNSPYMVHTNRMHYPMLRMALEYAGFRVRGLNMDRPKPKQQLLWPLAGLIMLVSKLRGRKGRQDYWLHETNSPTVLMGGPTLIITSVVEK